MTCEHSVYLTASGLAAAPWRNVPWVGSSVEETLQQWRLAAEYSCDRAALLVAQDVTVVTGALLKLFAGTGAATSLNVQAFRNQCQTYQTQLQSANPLVRLAVQQQLRQRTHPLPVQRVVELEQWAASDDYARILRRGKPLDVVNAKNNEVKTS